MLEQAQYSFSMRNARGAVSQGLHHIQAQVDSIEDAVSNEPGLAFDLAKTLVESTCRTILKDRGIPYNNDDDLPSLFRAVSRNLPMLPPQESHESEVRQSIVQTLGGLNTVIQGIAELRNKLGFASHGADRPRPGMQTVHAVLAADPADTIVGFLYDIHIQDRIPAVNKETQSTRDPDFDDHIDAIHDAVQIFDSEFFASDILFQMEPNSYLIFLAEFLEEGFDSEE